MKDKNGIDLKIGDCVLFTNRLNIYHNQYGSIVDGNRNGLSSTICCCVQFADGVTQICFFNELTKIDYYFGTDMVKAKSTPSPAPDIAVNDYVCKTCSNNRVSRTESHCWRCGYKLL